MKRRERDRFAAEELAVVLSYYDLGVIESVTEFKRGSRRSPKVGIVSERGKFLLKKRDRSRGGLERVRFIHRIQAHLAAKQFALPELIKPRGTEDSVLAVSEAQYELFKFVAGHSYSGEPQETRDAGRTLARFHVALNDFDSQDRMPRSGYHDAVAVQTALNSIPQVVSSHASAAGKDAEILGLTSFLFEAYTEAAEAVEQYGYDRWPVGITHSDWHPGNLLFKRGEVLAVIDYDCAKPGKPTCDVANGALQFAMVGGRNPHEWPDELRRDRLSEFLGGYEEVVPLVPDSVLAVPYLMIEALIAEAVLPIAATGAFGPFPGFGFLQVVRRKVEWMRAHVPELQSVA